MRYATVRDTNLTGFGKQVLQAVKRHLDRTEVQP